MKITALIPVKTDSTRLANKNFLDFCGQPLYRMMLDKLQEIEAVDSIIIDTDSRSLAEDCRERYSKAIVVDRPEVLRGDSVTMNSLIAHDITLTHSEHFLQTHCTNPLLSKATILKAISAYFEKLDLHDSLLSVESVQKRGYLKCGSPINHENKKLRPTQELDPIFIENSNLFLFSRTSFINASNSRVGKSPQLFPMSSLEGIDIDHLEDFNLASLIFTNWAALHEMRVAGVS
jgi:CMP-N-acetylneuraminic acid synthetase